MTEVQNKFPTTVEQTVRLLQVLVPPSEKSTIAAMAQDELTTIHFGLGQWVRNHLGLWSCSPALLAATGEQHADDASGVIKSEWWWGGKA